MRQAKAVVSLANPGRRRTAADPGWRTGMYPAGPRVTGFLPFPLFYELDGGEKSSSGSPKSLTRPCDPVGYMNFHYNFGA